MTGDLVQFCLNRLKTIEKDIILADDEDGKTKSFAVVLMRKLISGFKNKAAKNQYRL